MSVISSNQSVQSGNSSAISANSSVIAGGSTPPPVGIVPAASYSFLSSDYVGDNQGGTDLTNEGTTPTVNVPRGDVASFNGSTDYMRVPYAGNTTGAAGWSMWFNLDTISGFLFGNNSSTVVRVDINAASIELKTVANISRIYDFPAFSTSTWYQLFITRSASNSFNMYINAVVSTTGGITDTGVLSLNRLGTKRNGTGNFVDGLLDEVSYYTLEPSPAQVLANYNAQTLP